MIKIFSIPISQKDYKKTALFVKNKIQKKEKTYICVAAVHLVMECQENSKLLSGIQNAGLVTPDGMPLVWLSKLYGNKSATRVYGPNLMLVLCKLAEKFNYKVFLLGGSPGQSSYLVKKLKNRFPKLIVVGNIDTPTRPIPKETNKNIIKKINSSKADVVFVGLGCPAQELWMIENRDKVSASILIGVGAAFDFITNKVKQAPKWMQDCGLEWFYRLLQDPKRLWKRYTILNAKFLLHLFYFHTRNLFFENKS